MAWGATKRWRMLASLVVGALLLPVLSGNSSDVAGAAQACPVVFIGLRGSGAPYADAEMGMGPQVFASYTTFRDRMAAAGLSVRGVGLRYPAAPLPTDVASFNLFFESIGSGTDALNITIAAEVASCASVRIVLAGHSQGAAVVNRVVVK